MKVHYTAPYLLNPQHKITVNLVGLGGTGSQVLTCLARMNETLIALSHPGLHVYAWDADEVTMANIGRQLFSPADLGLNKATVLVTRVNRFFGTNWEARPEQYTDAPANILITCIDTAAGRVTIAGNMKFPKLAEPMNVQYYWLDMGNGQTTGQAVLGTLSYCKQPKSEHKTARILPTVIKQFPELKKVKKEDEGPSCSVAQSINRQDLFINSTLAQLGANLLWKLFREGMITVHGCYLNLATMIVNPIKIK
ncbi:PRTRC system ThiF family protein [Paraflavitalea sp. CAU 1676]|uniref:PRTRC system ThiF family protein n=1 Tax=Paraflavitalea sp. CAU 1676 TaxID=3032598 RepID=UPI0023DC74D5|nr:PRTRC system ThiF family protein [Paraflavitalea sp. CAU 1676]MDF2189315.1 PRTRC system ThiF family protein [Paraflavitalea sp. CAU 1676]